jgi:hypothetical protein
MGTSNTSATLLPYKLKGNYWRVVDRATGEREQLGPGDIVMLTSKRAKQLGAIALDPSTLQEVGGMQEVDED